MEYVFVSGKDFNEARRGIRELKGSGKTIVFSSNDDELARKVLEKEAIGILLIKSAAGNFCFQKNILNRLSHNQGAG